MRLVRGWRRLAAVAATVPALAGCSPAPPRIAPKTITVADLRAVVVPELNPPPVGDNTLDVTLSDVTGNGVPSANISALAATPLTGNTGATESGRSAGNGSYRIPIHTPLSEFYIVTFTIQRTGKPDVVMKYGIRPK
ncbi:MAG: hypothetical protein P4L33_08115 [Capsulimonadaceae bacterium]|nr:hypothetical protein [Capsulimonadaceae bacterium]